MPENQPSQISLNDWTNSQASETAGVEDYADRFRLACDQALQKLDLPPNFTKWQQNKAALVLKLGSRPVISISQTREESHIQIRTGYLAAEQVRLPLDEKDEILLNSQTDSNELISQLSRFFEQVIDQGITERFACCSLYRQCSAASACVQEDRALALACFYRLNLKKGQVFFPLE